MVIVLSFVLLILTRLVLIVQDVKRYGTALPIGLICWPLAAPVALILASLLLPASLLSAPVTRPVAYGLITVVIVEELALALCRRIWQNRWEKEHPDTK